MSVLEKAWDDWIGEDERDALDLLGEYLDEVVGDRLDVGQTAGAGDMLRRLDAIREQGWLDFAVDPDTSATFYLEAVKRLHRRSLPVSVPLFETWSALRLLARLGAGSAEAQGLLEEALSGARRVVLDQASLFDPREPGAAGGAVPFGEVLTSLVIVRDGGGLAVHAVEPGAGSRPAALIDPTLPAVVLESTGERLAGLDEAALRSARAEQLVAQGNALVGQAQAMLASTLAYLTTREQFGVPIGSFQALRHRAADVATEVYAAQQLSVHGGELLGDEAAADAIGLLVKSLCARAAVKTASEAVQLRGGMGFTWEDGTHFGLKRTMSLAVAGPTAEDCETALGELVVERGPVWAGGIDAADEREGAAA